MLYTAVPELRLISRNLHPETAPVMEAMTISIRTKVKITVMEEKMNAHLP